MAGSSAAAALVLTGCTSASPGASDQRSSPLHVSSRSATIITGPADDNAGHARPTHAPPTHAGTTHTVTLAFAGDVHFSGRVRKRLKHLHTVFAQAAPVLRRADLTMVNLETAITTRGVPQAKEYHFRAPAKALDALRYAGIDVATEANNHGADYGVQGLHDTIRAIATHHEPVIGIGKDARQAWAPYKTTINGVKIAIVAADQVHDETTLRLFTAGPHKYGVANAYQHRLVKETRRLHRNGWVVIDYLHWGIELQTCPSSDQTSIASKLAHAGAAAVIGTHAHVLLGKGYLPNGTFVDYGLGNYLWWLSYHNIQDDNGVLYLTIRGGKVVSNRFDPSHLDSRGIPVPARGAQRHRILAQVAHDRSCTDLAAHR